MTNNAADLLHAYFTASDKRAYKFPPLWAALVEIEANIDAWEEMGQRVTPFRDTVAVFKRELNQSVDTNFDCLDVANSIVDVGDLGMLEWISEKLSYTTPHFDEAELESIRNMLAAIKSAVIGDTTLPDDLRLHIARLIRHVEECVENWEITGDFAVAEALDRLMGAMRIAEAKSSKPETWTGLWDEWVQPVAIGLIASMPQVGLQIGQMLSITS